MIKYTLFKTRPPKEFEYSPRYHDESKERIEKLEKKFRSEIKRSDADPGRVARMKDEMHTQWGREHVSKQSGFQRMRFVIIMVVLMLALLFVYNQLDLRF